MLRKTGVTPENSYNVWLWMVQAWRHEKDTVVVMWFLFAIAELLAFLSNEVSTDNIIRAALVVVIVLIWLIFVLYHRTK